MTNPDHLADPRTKGGQTTLARHGIEHYQRMGRLSAAKRKERKNPFSLAGLVRATRGDQPTTVTVDEIRAAVEKMRPYGVLLENMNDGERSYIWKQLTDGYNDHVREEANDTKAN